jgi:hypothetical protein
MRHVKQRLNLSPKLIAVEAASFELTQAHRPEGSGLFLTTYIDIDMKVNRAGFAILTAP